MELDSVLLEENTRRAFRRAIAAGSLRAALVPLAATEQHNEHLAMKHDAHTVAWIARQAAQRLNGAVVVAPTLNLGISEHWMDHPGTLTLTPATFVQVVFEVCDSLRRAGLERILLLNGHGGNRRPLEASLPDLRERLGIQLEFCSYWQAYSPELVERLLATRECPGHAAEFETSTALAISPESVRFPGEPYPANEVHILDPQRAADDRRFFDGARYASADKGHEMLRVAVDWVETKLRELVR